MRRKRDGLVPIGEVLDLMDGPAKAIREASPQALHHFTRFDQVGQLVRASEADPDTGFMARLMALCSLPRTKPRQPKRVCSPQWSVCLSHERWRTQQTSLRQPAPIAAGLGFDRSSADPQSRELVLGRSLSGFMRKLGMQDDSSSRRSDRIRLQTQMDRLFNAHIALIYEDDRGKASVNSPVASRTEFWWNERKPDEPVLFNSKIRIGEDFFNEIIRHPVPVDMNILKAMKRSSLGLDLYLWLTYRTFSMKHPLRLSWRQLYRQFGVDPAKANARVTVDNFRRDCHRELKKIKAAWPDLNYSTAKGMLILLPSTPAIPLAGQREQ